MLRGGERLCLIHSFIRSFVRSFCLIDVVVVVVVCFLAGISYNLTKTDAGCNVTLVCLHSTREQRTPVVWIKESSGKNVTGQE